MKTLQNFIDELGNEPITPLPKDRGEPVFRDSWEAEAFAMGNLLVKSGFLSASEWMSRMGSAIKSAQMRGDPDQGDTYYYHWMDALELLCLDRGLTSQEFHHDQVYLWDQAIENTPHGVAISIDNAFIIPEAPNPNISHPIHAHRHHHHHGHDEHHSHKDDHSSECGTCDHPPGNFYEPVAIHRR